MAKVGFIGLGIMGKPMAKNLLKAGYELVVYDVVAAPLEEVVKAGAKAGSSPKDVAAQGDVIITMLPNSPHVKEAVLGKNGVIEGARKGSIVVDMSSIAPLVAQEVAAELAKKGVEMLDAPVSGGQAGAENGKLTIVFINPNNVPLLFPIEDGIEVLYRESNFGLNFARGLGIIFCWMALLATLGLAAALDPPARRCR